MQSKAATVDAYMEEISDERRAMVAAIRAIVNRAAPQCRESMAYGMPSWDMGGHWIALAWQRHCLALFVSDPELVQELADATGSRDFGMSCLRWPGVRHVKLEGLRMLIQAAAKRRESLMAVTAKQATAAAAAKKSAARREAAKKPAAKPKAARKPAAPRKAVAKKKTAAKSAAKPASPRKSRVPRGANGRADNRQGARPRSRTTQTLGHA